MSDTTKRKRRKPEVIWGIRQYGLLLPFLCSSQRRRAIAACVDYWPMADETWKHLSRDCGFTVHKLEVRDV
jgi:hypothetical protein